MDSLPNLYIVSPTSSCARMYIAHSECTQEMSEGLLGELVFTSNMHMTCVCPKHVAYGQVNFSFSFSRACLAEEGHSATQTNCFAERARVQ